MAKKEDCKSEPEKVVLSFRSQTSVAVCPSRKDVPRLRGLEDHQVKRAVFLHSPGRGSWKGL